MGEYTLSYTGQKVDEFLGILSDGKFDKNVTFNEQVTVDGGLSVNGAAIFDNNTSFTGDVTFEKDTWTNGNGLMYYSQDSNTGVCVGFGVGSSGLNHGVHSSNGGWMIYNDNVNPHSKISKLHITTASDISGIEDRVNGEDASFIIGNRSGAHMVFDANEIIAKSDGVTPARLNLNSDGGAVYVRGGEVFGAVELYYNNGSGTAGTVTLSQSVNNFTYIDIFTRYAADTSAAYTRVYNPNGRTVTVSCCRTYSNGVSLNYGVQLTISGNTITQSENYINNSNGDSADTNGLFVYRIVGYK